MVFTVYTNEKRTQKLLLSVNPASPRIGILSGEVDSPLTAPNFCMLMRKHLLSSTLLGIQLIGFDRIVKIDFLTSGEFKDAEIKSVYVELMGRYSNVILTQNGKILGGNRGINMFDNGVRPLIVGMPYVFPPVGDKKIPNDNALISCFNQNQNEEIANLITKNVQGVALSTAKEIEKEFITKYKNSEDFGENLFNALNDYLYNTCARPCVFVQKSQVVDVCVYPYETINQEPLFFDFLYQAEEYYFCQKDAQKRYQNKRERLLNLTNSAIKKAKKRLTAINSKQKDALSSEDNKLKGELLLANLYRLKDGQSECILENYYDGTQIKIQLDQNLSITQNAENYYKKYNKQKRTLTALEPQRKMAESELNYFLSVSDEVLLAETFDELLLVQLELENAGIIVQKQVNQNKKKATSFCREYCVDGFTVLVGRNNAENDKLTFTSAPDDVWVHVKDYHSSHVIIQARGKVVPEKVVLTACEICAYYSKGREGGKTDVVYTNKKNVKKPPKSKPGFCIYENFRSIVVKPEKHAEFLKSE